MANIYLEKIAAATAGGMAWAGAKAIGRVAGKGVKAVGHQVYKATGGTFIDHAYSLGVKDPYKLSEFNGSAKGIKKLRNLQVKKQLAGKDAKLSDVKKELGKFRNDTLPHLKRERTDARITVGALSAGAAYAAHKAKQKYDEPKVKTYDY